jgi:selenocysteine-specific elongation factor
VRGLLAATALAQADVVVVSATRGDGIPELRARLAGAAAAHAARAHAGRNFRFAIDRAFTIAGSGTVVTGTVFNGAVAAGDKLVISPAGIEIKVRAVQQHGSPAQQAIAGERCALNLSGAGLEQIGRGDWIVAPAIHAPTQRIDAHIQVLASEPRAVTHWTPVHLHLGTADVTARIAIRRGASIAPGTSGIAQLVLDRPVCALHGDRFIVRDQSASRTVGGGSVLDPYAPATRRHTPARRAQLAALEHADPGAALQALLACSAHGVNIGQFERAFNLTAERTAALLTQAGAVLVDKEQRTALPQASVQALKQRVLDALARFHRESPQALGADIEAQRKALAPELAAPTFLALLRELADERKAEVMGSAVRLPQHVATANPADERMWQAIKPLLDAAALNVPPLRELAPAAKLKEPILKDFLHRKSRTGDIIRVTPDRFYPRATLAQLAAIAQATAQAAPGGQFTAAQFRDRCGLGRSLAIEILECLDRLGITQRLGDARKMRKDFVPILGAATAPPAPAAPVARPPAKPAASPQRRPHFNQFKR